MSLYHWAGKILKCRPFPSHMTKLRCLTATSKPSAEDACCNDDDINSKIIDLEDAVAVVTGGASGIGFAIARQFLREGMTSLTIIDNDRVKGEKSLQLLRDEFGEDKIIFMEADVSNTEKMDDAFRNTVLHFDTIDLIVNNAGIIDDGRWERQLKTNMYGCIVGTLLGMQYMSKSSSGEGGIIVNIASTIGTVPSSGFPIYTMTQFGIVGFTKALGSSKLYSRTGVKIFGYCPGLTDTPLMQNMSEKAINDNFAFEYVQEIGDRKPQSCENVAKGLVSILDEAKPGSLWLIENDQAPFEFDINSHVVVDKKLEEDEKRKEKAERRRRQE